MMKKQNHTICIVGAGQWGTTLSLLAARQGHHVYLYERNQKRAQVIDSKRENKRYLPGITLPSLITITSHLKEACEQASIIIPVIPATAFRECAQALSPFIHPDHFLIHATKGLEPQTHKRMSEILAKETKSMHIGALSGPNLAFELARGQPAATVVASTDDALIQTVQSLLSSEQLRVYGSHDLIGVEWAGALKNILALAAGGISVLGLGQNALAMLLTRGLAEMNRLMLAVGAQPTTLLGLAGIGDIIATCTSPLSRNFRAGQMLARGKTPTAITHRLKMTVEGFNTIQAASEVATEKRIQLPITRALFQVIYKKRPFTAAFRELMKRPSTFEFDL